MSAELGRMKREAELARARFLATLSELQERLKPGNLASNAWEGVKDKSGELADGALEAVKGRPVAVSAALAGFALFLARKPITSAVSGLIGGDGEREPEETKRVEPKKARRRRNADKE